MHLFQLNDHALPDFQLAETTSPAPMLDRNRRRIVCASSKCRVDYEKLSDDRLGEPLANVQACVDAARDIHRERFSARATHAPPQPITCNADMRPAQIRKYCQLDETCSSLMHSTMNQMQLSERAYHRVSKFARTIADLVGEEKIAPTHLAEALQYRPKLEDDVVILSFLEILWIWLNSSV